MRFQTPDGRWGLGAIIEEFIAKQRLPNDLHFDAKETYDWKG